MFPYPAGVHAYPIALIIAIVTADALVLMSAARKHQSLSSTVFVLFVLGIAALLGAKLWRLGEMEDVIGLRYQLTSLEGFRAPGGFVGVCIGAVALVPIIGLRRLLTVLDLVSLPAAVAIAIVRVGCFLEGCCFGRVTTMPWGIRFPAYGHAWSAQLQVGLINADAAVSLSVQPLQLYFLALALSIVAALGWHRRRDPNPGEAFFLFLFLHETGKAFLESFRGLEPLRDLQLGDAMLACVEIGRAHV